MKRTFLIAAALLSIHLSFSQTSSFIVTDIEAKSISINEIEVTWQTPSLPESLDSAQLSIHLYRTTDPKAGSTALDDLTPIVVLPYTATSYLDRPDTIGTYYYTALVIFQDRQSQNMIIPDKNATVVGVQVLPDIQVTQEATEESAQADTATGLRNTPLPYLKLMLSQSANTSMPVNPERRQNQEPIPDTATATTRFVLPPHHIFRQEQEKESVGEDSILQEIVTTHFVTENYQMAEQALREFLSIHHTSNATDRGTFYLGEALLYQGKYRQALSCFLRVQDRFPNLAARWIKASLEGYQLPITE